jgi:hypothetical protein
VGRWLITIAWLASAGTAAGQEAAPTSVEGGTDAAKAIVNGTAEAPPAPPPPADAELRAEIKALRDSAEGLKATLDAVSAELGAEREQRAEEVISIQENLEKAHAAARAGLHFSGYLQADWNALNQASQDDINGGNGALLNDQRFLVRRARLKASIDREYAGGVLELDGNTVSGTTARLIGAEASVKLPGEQPDLPLAMLTVGLFKIPFGFEVQESDRDRLFMERSTAERALFPGEFDLGARLAGGWRFVRYQIAVQNGEPLGERTWPGRDPNAAKDVSGRLGVDTPITDGVRIAAGVSGLSGQGFHAGTPATKTTIQWNDRNQNGILDSGEIVTTPGVAALPSRNFSRFGYGADLRLGITIPGVGITTVYGEVYLAQNLDRGVVPADPYGPLSRNMREMGGYAAITQEILGRGALGVRFDYYNPDLDSIDTARVLVPTSFAYRTIAAVAAVTFWSTRFSVEYDANRNNLGRDVSGNPTNLASNTLIVRGQVVF